MNYSYSTSELKWSGKHDSHVLISWFQARRLGFFGFSPIKWRMAEGFHPKPLTRRFYLFSRQGTAKQCFTIHKWFPRLESHQRPSASQAAALSAELRGNGGDGESRTHNSLFARQARFSRTCVPKRWHPRQVSHPDLPH